MFDITWAALRLAIGILPVWNCRRGSHSGHLIGISYYPIPRGKQHIGPSCARIRLLGGTSQTLAASYTGASTLSLFLAGMTRLDVHLSTGIFSFTEAPGLRTPRDLEAGPLGEYFQKLMALELTSDNMNRAGCPLHIYPSPCAIDDLVRGP